jgi:hypothetical protein
MDGHVDPVGCHEGGQGVVDGDGVDGVARAKDVAEADVICERVELRRGSGGSVKSQLLGGPAAASPDRL